tara:strand:+ start:96 stop:740 length:645 start_codon:yes stop_codon:yes gene_type:complete
MSGTFPTTILPRSFQVINNRPTLINQSVSGKRVTRKYGSQYWTLEVGLPPLNKNDGLGVYGFLQQQQGSFEKFSFTHPEHNRGSAGTRAEAGLANVTAQVDGAHTAGVSSILLENFSFTSVSGDILKRGDVIKFTNHDKVYMITADAANAEATVGGSTDVTINIQPPLIADLANDEAVTLNKPAYSVYLTGDVGYTTDASGLYYYNFSLRECIE